jgi:hypothetical protein
MSDAGFLQQHRLSETAFTRSRKLNFQSLVTFLLQHRKGAMQTELDHFFGDNSPRRYLTKSACFQARKHPDRAANSLEWYKEKKMILLVQ